MNPDEIEMGGEEHPETGYRWPPPEPTEERLWRFEPLANGDWTILEAPQLATWSDLP